MYETMNNQNLAQSGPSASTLSLVRAKLSWRFCVKATLNDCIRYARAAAAFTKKITKARANQYNTALKCAECAIVQNRGSDIYLFSMLVSATS